MSLENLKRKETQKSKIPSKENVNALKETLQKFMKEKTETVKTEQPHKQSTQPTKQFDKSNKQSEQVKEVPEDVLRKILETDKD